MSIRGVLAFDTRRRARSVRALATMGGAPALGGAGAGAAEVEALLREFPALGRTEDGRVKCSLTGHVMHAKPEVVRPYVRGKRFTQASAKARAMDALKQFEPHIVRSAFLPDKLFCRITGRYLAANERAVAQHSAGRRFERGVEALSRLKTETGAKNVLLTERDPRVAETQSREAAAKREADADASRVVSAAKARAAAAATAEAEAEGRTRARRRSASVCASTAGSRRSSGAGFPPRTSSRPTPTRRRRRGSGATARATTRRATRRDPNPNPKRPTTTRPTCGCPTSPRSRLESGARLELAPPGRRRRARRGSRRRGAPRARARRNARRRRR